MNKIGLALSGGGFRASLYHLGLLRFLRDAGVLPQVSHITSVSGGSIMAAHLVLNWDRYTGSPNEFDSAAAELLAFVRLDLRNRIVRRFPLTLPLRWPRRLLGRSNRKLSRTGLLEYHYEKYLYGDTSLFELPEKPRLHILATNLSEGCLCSFTRDGLLMVRRQPGNGFRIDRTHIGLATVAMAVAASSAFPGFFPPVELTGGDVGTSAGEFGRQAYTDGAVFDNLGVRMFRCLERSLLAAGPPCRDDFVDFQQTIAALLEAGRAATDTPLRRLTQILAAACRRPELLRLTGNGTPATPGATPSESTPLLPAEPGAWTGNNEELVLAGLWNVMRQYQFRLDPLFTGLKPVDPDAEMLLQDSRLGGRPLDADDQLWLNRHLVEAAFQQATGHPCFRRLSSGLDGVLVSDVGKSIEVQSNHRAGGLIRTAMRATDILMDRVWQLENETFRGTPGFVFAPITDVVEPSEDPTALHPEIQRQAANIRTDLDRFSMLEISTLVRHGYCVGRKACRAHPELFGRDLPGKSPWDPVPPVSSAAPPARVATHLDGQGKAPAPATVEARTLQASAFRRIWSTLLDRRDWTTYIYVPLLVPILLFLPYVIAKSYQRSHRLSQLVDTLSQGSRDLEQMSRLMDGPMKPWVGENAEEVRDLGELNLKGFEILQDSHILDLRNWKSAAGGKGDAGSTLYGYRRYKVVKLPENNDNQVFRIRLLSTSAKAQVRFPQQQLQPRLRMSRVDGAAPGHSECHWEVSFDFQKVPAGDLVDLVFEYVSPGDFIQGGEHSSIHDAELSIPIAEMTRWVFMPTGKEYRNFRLLRSEKGKPGAVEPVKLVTEYLAEDSTILAYKLLAMKPGYAYDLVWDYK